jgi:hypothetical protein
LKNLLELKNNPKYRKIGLGNAATGTNFKSVFPVILRAKYTKGFSS